MEVFGEGDVAGAELEEQDCEAARVVIGEGEVRSLEELRVVAHGTFVAL
jgi:hypothetical protein